MNPLREKLLLWYTAGPVKRQQISGEDPTDLVMVPMPLIAEVIAALALPTEEAAKDETAWLIESPEARWGTGYFWCATDRTLDFGTIDKAVRFSRKEDAERVIELLNSNRTYWRHSRLKLEACEHLWPTPATPEAAEQREGKWISAAMLAAHPAAHTGKEET